MTFLPAPSYWDNNFTCFFPRVYTDSLVIYIYIYIYTHIHTHTHTHTHLHIYSMVTFTE